MWRKHEETIHDLFNASTSSLFPLPLSKQDTPGRVKEDETWGQDAAGITFDPELQGLVILMWTRGPFSITMVLSNQSNTKLLPLTGNH